MRQYQASHTSETFGFGLRRLRLALCGGLNLESYTLTQYRSETANGYRRRCEVKLTGERPHAPRIHT
ncbi:hypothetical protein EVAR_18922_1 [Eumeta japonica]|uniref:Uncharacterized protein n=1 Tax=Eumeta variegata TaxID=151549 RepID=A0A4C1V2M1_EUMVA|nr:hypothetical protein EVAR_18922_1 [Eumeta japonica]